jgi:hypothetical protein
LGCTTSGGPGRGQSALVGPLRVDHGNLPGGGERFLRRHQLVQDAVDLRRELVRRLAVREVRLAQQQRNDLVLLGKIDGGRQPCHKGLGFGVLVAGRPARVVDAEHERGQRGTIGLYSGIEQAGGAGRGLAARSAVDDADPRVWIQSVEHRLQESVVDAGGRDGVPDADDHVARA